MSIFMIIYLHLFYVFYDGIDIRQDGGDCYSGFYCAKELWIVVRVVPFNPSTIMQIYSNMLMYRYL